MPRRYLARNEEQGPKMPLASAIRAAGSREFWVITLANLLVMTSCYPVFVVTAAYVRETWHTSLSVTGLAVGVMIMGCLVGRFVSGNLVSLLGCRKGSVRPCQPLFSGLWHSHTASRPLAGRIFDRCGENVLPVPIFCLTAVALFLLAQAHSGAVLLLSGLFLGLGFGNFQSIGQAVSLAMVTLSRFAQATTTCFTLFDLGGGAGPWLFGHLVPAFGFAGMYLTLEATTLASLVLYYLVHGRKMRFVRQ